MAAIDMPLVELREYMGINPRPDNFDSYWADALAEMRAVDRDVTITPAEFTADFADCYDMYFTGVGGARIYAKLLKPNNICGKCRGLVEFHGYSGSSGDWFNKLAYAANGFVVASMDCRGQGGKSEDVGSVKGTTHHGHIIRGLEDSAESLLYRSIFLDAAELASIIMDMEEVDGARVGAIGGSQGGGLALACAALEPGIARVAPIHPFLCDYKRFWVMDLETGAYDELKQFFRRFDPLHENEEMYFERLGYIDVQNLVERITGKVLFAATLRDDICPPSTQFAAFNKIQSEKELVLYHDFAHEALPGFSDRQFAFFADM